MITHPFLSADFTDLPMTSGADDPENSITSQSVNSADDTADTPAPSSSRRKSRHPKQVPRSGAASRKGKGRKEADGSPPTNHSGQFC
jgi:hypothetical protein